MDMYITLWVLRRSQVAIQTMNVWLTLLYASTFWSFIFVLIFSWWVSIFGCINTYEISNHVLLAVLSVDARVFIDDAFVLTWNAK